MLNTETKNGWGGNSIIKFEIKRFLNKENNELIADLKNINDINLKINNLEEINILLEAYGSAYCVPSHKLTNSEKHYDAEEDSEISYIVDPNGDDWYELVTESEKKDIMFRIIESIKTENGHHCYGRDSYNC